MLNEKMFVRPPSKFLLLKGACVVCRLLIALFSVIRGGVKRSIWRVGSSGGMHIGRYANPATCEASPHINSLKAATELSVFTCALSVIC